MKTILSLLALAMVLGFAVAAWSDGGPMPLCPPGNRVCICQHYPDACPGGK